MSKKTHITTQKDCGIFQKWFLHYREKFGLQSYNIYFSHKKLARSLAEISSDPHARTSTVTLSIDWKDISPTENELRKTALHECLHLLLAKFDTLARKRYVSDDELYEEDEALTMRLEELIAGYEHIPFSMETLRDSKKSVRKKTKK